MSVLPHYVYEPLPEGTGIPSIRLVTIEPGLRDSKIICQLQAVSLAPFPDFEALSYVWGAFSVKRSIEIGKVLEHPAGPRVIQGRILRVISNAAITGLVRMFRTAQRKTPLDVLMGMFKFWKATDPRDMVYALLGLAHLSKSQIVPNYEESLASVYRDLTISFIHETGNLNAIGLCTEANKCLWKSGESIPSWVPDYRMPGGYSHLVRFTKADKQLYNASGSSQMDCQQLKTAPGGVISLRGIFWDRIQRVSQPTPANYWGSELQATIRDWQDIAVTSKLYKQEDTAIDAFWRTLLRDYAADTDVIIGTRINAIERIDMRYADHYRELYYLWLGGNLVDYSSRREAAEDIRRNTSKRFQKILELDQVLKGYCFFITEKGYMGVVLGPAHVGDSACIVDGSCVPLILRPSGSDVEKLESCLEQRPHILVGTAYVHGIMDGEILEAVERGEAKKAVIFLK